METKHRRSIFWPLLLIAIGAVFLLNTLGFIQGDGWYWIFKLWPLLFIIAGLDTIFQGRSYIWAIVSLGLGAVLLLANFDYLPSGAINLLLRLWPLLLIAAGLDLIFRGRSALMSLFGTLLAVLVTGGVIWIAMSGISGAAREQMPISEPLGEASSLNVYISNPTGRVEIGSSDSPEMAIEGILSLAPRQTVDHRYQARNGVGDLQITSSGETFTLWVGGPDQPLWALKLNREVPIALTVNTSAGEQHIDLRGLEIENLDCSVAVGQLDLVLPEEGEFNARLANSVGLIQVAIPPGALVEIRTDSVFLTKSIPAGFIVSGDLIYSPGAHRANADIHLAIDQPIGRLELLTTP